MKKQNKPKKMYSPAIIIIAHDRPKSLERLLKSIQKSNFSCHDIPLVISIDKSDENDDVCLLAKNFLWSYGKKKLINQTKHLGLKKHVHFCGDLIKNYGAAIVLEDDLIVAPYFYEYALQSMKFYKNEPNVAGISLYSYRIAESCFYPFDAIDDGYDNYFMQIASSWGQLWTEKHWNDFKDWLHNTKGTEDKISYPAYLKNWGNQSWKKEYIQYLIAKDLYFVFPRVSHTTNFEDRGTHASSEGMFQVPIQRCQKKYVFSDFSKSKSKYDAWFELKADVLKTYACALKEYDFIVDLYGKKESQETSKYRLTTRRGKYPIYSFSAVMQPLVSNVISHIAGNQIHLFQENNVTDKEAKVSLFFPNSDILQSTLQKNIDNELLIEIILPISSWKESSYIPLLKQLVNQSHTRFKCWIVCNISIEKDIELGLRKHQLNTQFQVMSFSEELTNIELVEKGFQQVTGDMMCWINPDCIIHNQWLQSANDIFNMFKNIRWLQCINNEESSIDFRWNQKLFLKYIKKSKKHHITKGMFIASHIWKDMGNQFSDHFSTLKEEDWILRTLKYHKNYLFIDRLNKVNINRPDKKIDMLAYKKVKEKYGKRNRVLSVFLPFLKKMYVSQVPFFRAFYPLFYNLDDVIKYDEKMKTYYFDRY